MDSDSAIASAVVVPEELQAPASPTHKRRNSSITEDSAKRPRLDDDQKSPPHKKPARPTQRERGRERRLFGAVLGALSQNPTTAGQKRRAEIEKKQQERRQSENEESLQRKAERIARRREQREREQKRVEEDMMRTRHLNMRNMARFLKTKTEPHLYYKPWETSPEENDLIQEQIAEAEEAIKREVEEHEGRQQEEVQRSRDETQLDEQGTDRSQPVQDQTAAARQEADTVNGEVNISSHSSKDLEMRENQAQDSTDDAEKTEHDTEMVQKVGIEDHETATNHGNKDVDDEHGDDVMEEAAEDTVIY